MKVTEKLKDKSILIWGYGREGKSSERFIKEFCNVKKLDIFEGSPDEIDSTGYDYVLKSPGIKVDHFEDNYTSQTELFMEEFAARTIGITGTKGKSTTSSLLYKVLSACQDKKVLLVGNLGYPCLDYYSDIDKDTVIVFEMSCHQLANLKYSPHVGVFLNLYEDHLDTYGTMENYFNAKKHIALTQTEDDYYIFGDTVPAIETRAAKIHLPFASDNNFKMKLMGKHNQYNARVVHYIATNIYGCDEADVLKVIENFTGLEHRLEFVATINGVDYYDDSISTIPEATIRATTSIPNAKTVLIGGMDRGISYDILIDFIKANPDYMYIFSYASGKRIFDEVSSLGYCYYEATLEAAVKKAKELTPAGSACILSPAAASYDHFKDFEDRGDMFKKLISKR